MIKYLFLAGMASPIILFIWVVIVSIINLVVHLVPSLRKYKEKINKHMEKVCDAFITLVGVGTLFAIFSDGCLAMFS